jgi:CelD/BcsL family acetyltransferase involved in cellulose biosynthesis
MAFRARLAASRADLEALEGEWQKLAAARPQAVLARFEVARAWARAHEDALTPFVVVAEDGNRRAIAPLARAEDGRVVALGESVEPLATDAETLRALADAAHELTADAPLDLGPVRGDSPSLAFFRRVLGPEDAATGVLHEGFSRAVMLRPGESPAALRDAASRKVVRTLESRFPVQHRTVDPAHLAEAIGWMVSGPVRSTRRAAREAQLVEERRAAWLEALATTLPAGMLAVRALYARDEPIAMLAGLVNRRVFRAIAYAISGELARYAPLSVCAFRTVAWAADRELREVDFGTIGAAFDARWADVHRPLLRVARSGRASRAVDLAA